MLYRIEKVVSACDIHYMENLPKYQLIDKDWIINTLELVSNKKITIAKACENAKLIGMNGFFRISTKTFYKSCRFNNIKTNLSRGVAPKMKINEAENIIYKNSFESTTIYCFFFFFMFYPIIFIINILNCFKSTFSFISIINYIIHFC